MLILAIIVGLITAASGIAVLIMLGNFVLAYASTFETAPEFVEPHNILAWLLFAVIFILGSVLLKILYKLLANSAVRTTVLIEKEVHKARGTTQRTVGGISGGFIVASIIILALTIVGLISGVNHFADFAYHHLPFGQRRTYHPDFNHFVKFVYYIYFAGLLLPKFKNKNNDEEYDDDEDYEEDEES